MEAMNGVSTNCRVLMFTMVPFRLGCLVRLGFTGIVLSEIWNELDILKIRILK